MEPDPLVHARKSDHIEAALKPGADRRKNSLDRYRVLHNAIPEINANDIDATCDFLGRTIRAPFMIASLTGGTPEAARINRNLAIAAQKCGVPLALGSSKIVFRDPAALASFQVRELCPNVPLLANLGLADLDRAFTVDDCRRMMKDLAADALIFHVNPVHEALQAEGARDFTGRLDGLRRAVETIGAPVIVKEVGHGISRDAFEKLDDCGLWAIDIAGASGTSWGFIEAQRAADPVRKSAAMTFADYGIPTVDILESLSGVHRSARLIASGGVRTGLDIFKSLCLGADFAAAALPFLKPAIESADAVHATLEQFLLELKTAMLGAGIQTIREARPSLLIS